MIVRLRNPRRELEMRGPMSVVKLLQTLEIDRETVLLIRNGTLVPGDSRLEDEDEVEIRSVISGGMQ
jgi:sulfur carrier protein